ncbi:LysR family transcriptional regulator [Viridibacillus arvi]|uniref:HTH lysR-type domain-containing protein n=1 Tax=Viridibacillus arvi TaxID=263475 RepID=A0A0M0LME8_9BACL|nr:LysR family transcriptional regulator [Viridibacillus arvi]KOO51883.1 hypothetical protein AMD00_05470 [Viridibacillus arvi]
MNIEQLQYIIKVSELRSISIASKNLHVSQSGISMAISSLEKELGVKIFNRSRAGTIPTEAGFEIIKKAYEAMGILKEIKDKAQSYTDTMENELRLASTQSMFLTILPKSLAIFKEKYPQVNIIIEEKANHDVIDDVKDNKINIGLMSIPSRVLYEDELEFNPIIEGKLTVVVSKHSPLAHRKSITPQDLLGQSLVVYNGPKMQLFIQNLFKHFGPINILFSTNNMEVIKKTVSEGLAISFYYEVGVNNDPYFLNGEVIAIPLINVKHDSLFLGWLRSKKYPLSNTAIEFIKCLESEIANPSH